MSKQPLEYRGVAGREDTPQPRIRWQTIVSCCLLGMSLACVLAVLVWPHRRVELISAAISLGITGAIVYFPYVRT